MARVRVLLAEDSKLMARQIGAILADSFELLATVGDGRALVRFAREMRPEVVITDLSMPEMTGIEAVQQLLTEHPALGIVFLTVHSETQVVKHAQSLGICSYVLKSDAGDDLVPAVLAAATHLTFVSSSLRAAGH